MKYFLINASVGLTAEANRFFNNPDAVLSLLKRVHTGTAILDAALKTIFSYRNIRVTLRSDDESVFSSNLTNLGVVKNPHFSGNLSYGGPAAYDDGLLNIHLCHDMSRFEILRLLKALGVGRFSSIPKTRSWTTDAVEVTSEHAFAVEFDGEIVSTKHAKFSVLKKHLKVCQ